MFGGNTMDLSLRPPAARAGYDQGGALAEQLIEFGHDDEPLARGEGGDVVSVGEGLSVCVRR
jgi:hypothetical protein